MRIRPWSYLPWVLLLCLLVAGPASAAWERPNLDLIHATTADLKSTDDGGDPDGVGLDDSIVESQTLVQQPGNSSSLEPSTWRAAWLRILLTLHLRVFP